ncbi:flagellar basal-body MS-ring/collar protein FliF [Egicoccus sp. AB-alg6-2]|uniref:flagellar basal-body MS-ring/collar protein FliF n=1 Tax=Egicoccus sp. AB-alg6-2 TaxID=3242692 RepID=UPI00359D7011
MELKDRLNGLMRSLPPAQRVGIVVAIVVLVMAAVPFMRWVTTPSYALLFAGLEDKELSEVVNELETRGVPYQLDGARVLVPQQQLHRVRADLASSGVSGTPTVPGYELLDNQALGVSDFRQRVDLQRAVEGELSRTLGAMDGIDSATVRLVIPEESLFTEQREPASASVLIRAARPLNSNQIEAVTLLVSSAVEGLSPDQVTVADTAGNVLHAPGDGVIGGVSDRQQRLTREFESALNADLQGLVQRATGFPASVSVRAALNFDESEIQTETFDADGTPLRNSTSTEQFEGEGAPVGGVTGVDGGPLPTGNGPSTYTREDTSTEFGVGRTTTRTVQAPGNVEDISVALVVENGAEVTDAQLRELVGAAAGIAVPLRADAIAITRVASPPDVLDPVEEVEPGLMSKLESYLAMGLIVLIAIMLFLMSRRNKKDKAEKPVEKVVPAKVRPAPASLEDALDAEPLPTGPRIQDEVAALVERQPDEIASLLRGWLADRRAGV